MRLFRGYKERPVIMTPEHRGELEGLRSVRRSYLRRTKDLGQLLRKMGEERFNRWYALEQANGPQSFTDNETVANAFAGTEGFVVSMEIPDALAARHYRGVQQMSSERRNSWIASQTLSSWI